MFRMNLAMKRDRSAHPLNHRGVLPINACNRQLISIFRKFRRENDPFAWIDDALIHRRGFAGQRPMARAGSWAFLGCRQWVFITHLGSGSQIHGWYRCAEFDGNPVGVETVDGMNETVIDYFRHPKAGGFQTLFDLPKIGIRCHADGNMVEGHGPSHWNTMIFFRDGFGSRPLEKRNHVVGRDFKKVVPISGTPQAGHQAHTKQISPESYGRGHVAGDQGQMVDATIVDPVVNPILNHGGQALPPLKSVETIKDCSRNRLTFFWADNPVVDSCLVEDRLALNLVMFDPCRNEYRLSPQEIQTFTAPFPLEFGRTVDA